MNLCSSIVAVSLMIFANSTVASQDESGAIHGTVYGPTGGIVRNAPIQATHTVSGEFERTRSSAEGRYQLMDLAAGSYKLTISMPCCAYGPYESDDVEVVTGATSQFEIHMGEGDSFNTVGDDPGIIADALRDRQVIPDLPVPLAANEKPDFSGVWLLGEDPFPEDPVVHPWVAEVFAERVANGFRDAPHTRCLPGGPPTPGGAAPFIAKFVQTEDLLVILFEDVPGFRQVFLDGTEHPDDPNPSWLGHSVGHWDGDVLVIDTVGFNARGWINGRPRTEELHIVERYSRSEYGRTELNITIEDPGVFMQPWVQNVILDLVPQEELIEYVCENNKWAAAAYD